MLVDTEISGIEDFVEILDGLICSGRYRITADAAIGIMLPLVVKYELLANNVDIVEAYLNGNLDDDNDYETTTIV
uniref:Uncharacterized protein n=1 Tax=Glossina pallidipes TaxID=7398 RepID=A0A1A9ZWC0_GLOPL